MEVVSQGWRKLWNEWQLRLMIIFSLIFQIALIIFGNRRKYDSRFRIKVILWSAYLMADSVAATSLGVLSKDLSDVYSDGSDHVLDANNELTAFWAPFLLLHLGGPDTITAYALEDNELWLRHTFGLVSQTIAVVYIFLMAWTGSHLSILSMLMISVGSFKYAERTWVLCSASNEQLRKSMLTPPQPGPDYAKFIDEFSLKQAEGFYVRTEDVTQDQDSIDISGPQSVSIADVNELRKASELIKRFKLLFVDLLLSFHDRNFSQSLFRGVSYKEAFKVIEIELGLMYDLFYTKADVAYTPAGLLRRLFCIAVTCFVLMFFSFGEKKKYEKIDIIVTYLLLFTAIVLELYALLVQLTSDQTDIWLSSFTRTWVTKAITCLQLPKSPRCSNYMAQFSLLSICLEEEPGSFLGVQKLLHIDDFFENIRYTTRVQVSDSLRKSIFEHMKKKYEELMNISNVQDVRAFCTCRGGLVLEKYKCLHLDWSIKVNYDQTILIWHIATELCHTVDHRNDSQVMSNREISKHVSHYMLYLLVRYPSLLPFGIWLIRFRDTCAEAKRFFVDRKTQTSQNGLQDGHKLRACKMLLSVMNTRVPPKKVKGDGSISVLFDACKLALQLNEIQDTNRKWDMISEVWVEMLAYAANQCRGRPHAQQLRRGGELLTHVWLLMAHFGITEQFQSSEGRAKLIVL